MKIYISILFVLLLAGGCHATESPVDWPIDEVIEEDSSQHDCPAIQPHDWEPAEVPFNLYQFLACRRGDDENLIFSPAAIYIALAEIAEELDGADGQAIAELLGYNSPQQLAEGAQNYRDALLELRPRGRTSSPSIFQDYEIAEDDAERLWEAQGVEFFSVQCASQISSPSCRWEPQNDRWSESFLDDDVLTRDEANDLPRTQSIVLRAQWHKQGIVGDMDFHADKDKIVETTTFSTVPHHLGEVGDVTVLLRQTVGEELAFIAIKSTSYTLQQLEETLSSSTVDDWLNSLEEVGWNTGPFVSFPAFDLQETVEITEALSLSIPLHSTTRLAMTREGLTFPDTVELEYPDQLTPPMSGTVRDDAFALDQPFLFLVYDQTTESIVLMGRIVDPTAE